MKRKAFILIWLLLSLLAFRCEAQQPDSALQVIAKDLRLIKLCDQLYSQALAQEKMNAEEDLGSTPRSCIFLMTKRTILREIIQQTLFLRLMYANDKVQSRAMDKNLRHFTNQLKITQRMIDAYKVSVKSLIEKPKKKG